MITYSETKDFSAEEIQRLFCSVHWESGRHPEQVVKGLKNSSTVISAWDGERLVGLVRGLDDGAAVGFLHYLLVDPEYQGMHIGYELMTRIMEKYRDFLHVKIMPSDPETIPFYEKFGFRIYANYTAMEKKNL